MLILGSIHAFWLTKIVSSIPVATYLEKGDMDVWRTRPPSLPFRGPQPLHKTLFSAYFSSTRPPFKPKITIFSNFPLKIPKFGNFSCSYA